MLNVKFNDYDYDELYLNDSCKNLSSDGNKNSIWRLDWSRAIDNDIEQYKFLLNSLLDPIIDELKTCDNFECNYHSDWILEFFDRITEAMNEAANLTIPKTKVSCKKEGFLVGMNMFNLLKRSQYSGKKLAVQAKVIYMK